MSGFQIKNKEGKVIAIDDLDREVAEFWKREVHPKQYANPTKPFENKDNLEGNDLDFAKIKHDINQSNNWFDAIGWYIAKSKAIEYPDNISWYNIMTAMVGNSLLQCFYDLNDLNNIETMENPSRETHIKLYAILEYYKPYFALIKHWHDKGYTPHRVE